VEAEGGTASAVVVAVAFPTASAVEAAAFRTVSLAGAVAFPTASVVAVVAAFRAASVAVAFHTASAAAEFGWAALLNSEELRAEAASVSAAGALAVHLASAAHLESTAHLVSVEDRRNPGSQERPVFEVSSRLQRAETALPATDQR
jgi:hypothetical protein